MEGGGGKKKKKGNPQLGFSLGPIQWTERKKGEKDRRKGGGGRFMTSPHSFLRTMPVEKKEREDWGGGGEGGGGKKKRGYKVQFSLTAQT